MRKARWHFVGGLVAGAIYSVSSGLGLPLMIKTLLPIFFGREDEAPTMVVEFSRRLFGESYVEKLLLVACLGLPLIFLVRGVAAFANRYWINKAGFIVLESLRMEVYERMLSLPLAFYQRNQAGDLVTRLMNDTDKLKNVVVNVSSEILKQPLTLVSALGYLVYLSLSERSALFALIAILSVPLCIIPIRIAAKQLIKRSRQIVAKGGALAAIATETFQSPLEVQAYNLQDSRHELFAIQTRVLFHLSLKTVKYQALVPPLIEVISVCGFVAALYFGTRAGMDFATFSSLALALYLSYEPVKKLSGIHSTMKVGEASLERLEFVLDAEDTVPDPPAPAPIPAGPREIVFDSVSFSYPPRGDNGAPGGPALDGLSLRVAPGETVALVGRTGAGKSTFITLLPRFYDPTSGRITLAGLDLKSVSKKQLRDRIAIVPQTPVLFNATLADNIRLGRPGASDADVVNASRRAHVHDFIAGLPQGYETVVGERGATLSGGQRQRIAIARAFLKDAPILILDEATSALDSESEAKIQEALDELVQGRTTFMIAHRFSSIRNATRVLVFEQGRIVADGSHAALYEGSEHYRQLYDRQTLDEPAR
jgi:subfamily B ATP-binding cassette protein MsbA